jgi:hypothetical protein
MEVEEWVPVDVLGSFSVDVTDDVNTIISGSSYFIYDGVQVPTTFSSITNGYSMFYTPVNVMSSGVISLIAHVENDIAETEEREFSFLYGYNTKFDEVVDWGPNNLVTIRAQVSNTVLCPNTVGEGFCFTTADLKAKNLGAFIQAVEYVDLSASISPQSTTFFYGQTFRITVSGVKDFSGNQTPAYTFSFTIEDPPN